MFVHYLVYRHNGMEFYSLKALEHFFCLKDGAGSRMIDRGEIQVYRRVENV